MTLYLETPGAKAPFPRGPEGARFHEAFFHDLVSPEHGSLLCLTGRHPSSRNYRR
jgi:hypothetical protein